ncbi:MAG: Hypothetical protein AJITA_01374 [Acetilactobacillus jinshanensis]
MAEQAAAVTGLPAVVDVFSGKTSDSMIGSAEQTTIFRNGPYPG